MIERDEAARVAELLAGVGEVTRMRVLDHLRAGPSAVGPLAAALEITMVNLSHHLNVLRRLGVLTSAKAGRQVVYALNPALYDAAAGALAVGPWRLVLAPDSR